MTKEKELPQLSMQNTGERSTRIASFPCPAQLTVLKAMESWAGPGNGASTRILLEHKPSHTLRMYPISKSRINIFLKCTSMQLESRI